ncbi:DUF2971 domain-containing protein [Shewanella glacialipiscicola]|uniref:DUF2971 domain-containing protein n=1 Tax=Shewanella glacialipiscicola TaxID=614069 RepID=UPI003D7B9576
MSNYIHFPHGASLPESIYKYVSFQEHHIRSLLTDELYFSSPDAFNDPYEPFMLFEGDKRFGEPLTDNLKKSAITCFSRCNNNFTLWSYYANGMKGICIEYDTKKLLASLTADFKAQWLYAFDVKYLEAITIQTNGEKIESFGKIPVVNLSNLVELDYNIKGPELIKIFATKPSVFKSEDEFRLVIRPENSQAEKESMAGLYKYKRDCIKSIIFGEKTPQADVTLTKMILGCNIMYKLAKVDKDRFFISVE